MLEAAMGDARRGGTTTVLASVDQDGVPSTALISWVVSLGRGRIAAALDHRSTAYRNVAAGRASLAFEVLAEDRVLSARGRATIVKQQMGSVPFPCALAVIDITDVRDHSVSGVRFQAPSYVFEDGKAHRISIEQGIFAELASS